MAEAGATATGKAKGKATATTRPRPPWTTVKPFLVGLACFAVLALVNEARDFALWRNYALSGIGLGGLTTYLVWRADWRLPHYIQWVIVAGLLLHYGGGSLGSPDPFRMGLLDLHGVNGAYHEFTWWDNLTHGVGIGAGAMAIAYLAEAYQLRRGFAWPGWAVGAIAVLGALAAGVVVELYEYLGKSAFQTIDQGGYVNTMRDLHFNVLGALAGAVLAVLIDRGRMGAAIVAQWGRPGADLADAPWPRRVTPGLVGFVTFTILPTLATIALSLRFIVDGAPPAEQDGAAYETALRLLLWGFLTGSLAGPTVTLALRRIARARSRAASREALP